MSKMLVNLSTHSSRNLKYRNDMIKPLSTVSFSLQSDLIIENFCRFLIRIIPTNCITCAKDVLNVFILGYNIISRALFDLIYLMNILFDQNDDMYKNFSSCAVLQSCPFLSRTVQNRTLKKNVVLSYSTGRYGATWLSWWPSLIPLIQKKNEYEEYTLIRLFLATFIQLTTFSPSFKILWFFLQLDRALITLSNYIVSMDSAFILSKNSGNSEKHSKKTFFSHEIRRWFSSVVRLQYPPKSTCIYLFVYS